MTADARVGFSGSLLSQSWRTGLQEFQGFTLAHPQLVEAKDKLMAAIQGSPSNSLSEADCHFEQDLARINHILAASGDRSPLFPGGKDSMRIGP